MATSLDHELFSVCSCGVLVYSPCMAALYPTVLTVVQLYEKLGASLLITSVFID